MPFTQDVGLTEYIRNQVTEATSTAVRTFQREQSRQLQALEDVLAQIIPIELPIVHRDDGRYILLPAETRKKANRLAYQLGLAVQNKLESDIELAAQERAYALKLRTDNIPLSVEVEALGLHFLVQFTSIGNVFESKAARGRRSREVPVPSDYQPSGTVGQEFFLPVTQTYAINRSLLQLPKTGEFGNIRRLFPEYGVPFEIIVGDKTFKTYVTSGSSGQKPPRGTYATTRVKRIYAALLEASPDYPLSNRQNPNEHLLVGSRIRGVIRDVGRVYELTTLLPPSTNSS